MKWCIGCWMVALLAIVLQCNTALSAGNASQSSDFSASVSSLSSPARTASGDSCFFTQSPDSTRLAIKMLCNRLAAQSFCLEHTNHTQLPDCKQICLLLKELCQRMASPHTHTFKADGANPALPAFPPDYYVFALREIIV